MQQPLSYVIPAFVKLREYINSNPPPLQTAVQQSCLQNTWFTKDSVNQALDGISSVLTEEKCSGWLAEYRLLKPSASKTVGLVAAGNIPMVGLHDALCVLAAGHSVNTKLSSSDKYLIPHLLGALKQIEPKFKDKISFSERLTNFDAIIATGSNNTSRYFEYYFGKYPHIIRKNRNSVAVLSGNETQEDFIKLGSDVFSYFGLGCRNVSKIYVPFGYSFDALLSGIEPYSYVINHHKYANNYDYNLTLLMMNRTQHYANRFLILSENESYSSPISVLYFEYYKEKAELEQKLKQDEAQIQCIVSKDASWNNSFAFGESQKPELWNYADGIDTMEFLLNL